MSYTTVIESAIKSYDALGTHAIEFRLPTTELKSLNVVQTPHTITHLLDPDEVWTLDLSNLGEAVRLIGVKTSRPVKVKLVNSALEEYNLPYSTYVEYLLDSTEDLAEVINSVVITVAPEPVTAPTQRPARYPKCLLEVFILNQ